MQRRFHRIATRCGCREHVVKEVYHTAATPAGLDSSARSSYAIGTSSVGAGHGDCDYPDLGLDTTVNFLS
jgi:hypothetical protein